MADEVSIFWFRRDLRIEDNAGLYHALKGPYPVLPVFIFDKLILNKLENKKDKRVSFIRLALEEIQKQLLKENSALEVFYNSPPDAFKILLSKYKVKAVFTNNDYEPYAVKRDALIGELLSKQNIPFYSFKDQVIFEKSQIIKDNGDPYTIFTPYSKKWKLAFSAASIQSFSSKKYFKNFYRQPPQPIPSLKEIGFDDPDALFPPKNPGASIIEHYAKQRDFPGINGTSRLGVHLRFGTISIRQLAKKAAGLSPVYLNELIWRDFYHVILWHFPQVGNGRAFKPAYERIEWRRDEGEFDKWRIGQTGYPIVDAGMRQLNETGFMHNRVRMITASFLCKHLLLDWRLGEAYFAEKLLDFDLAANNGGWQWAAGSGCDAAPYFRIFNPWLQTKKFDPQLTYIKKWVPEFQEFTYPNPMVDHEFARKRCIEVYSKALRNKE